MIATLAEFKNTRRRAAQTRLAAAERPCNDNHRIAHPVVREVAPASHRVKQALVSHWHTTPAGTLECVWEIEPTADPQPPRGYNVSSP